MANPFGKIDTLLSLDRLCNLIKYSTRCQNVQGDICEFGVFRGGSLEILAKFNPDKQVFGLDSFCGLPKTGEFDLHNEGDFDGVNSTHLSGYFAMIYPNVRIVKGFSPKVFDIFDEHHRFSFLHLDVDVFSSIKDGLDFFFPRINEGGIILIDDFKIRSTPACEKAVLEFMEDKECAYHGEVTDMDGRTNNQYLIVK